MKKTQLKEQEKIEALDSLKGILKPGNEVYTSLKHVSSSGMTRHIQVLVAEGERITDISYLVGKALDYKMNKYGDGLVVSGCGMDMGFSVIYNLSSVLFKDGFTCLGDYCPSNDHANGDRNRDPHEHKSGGYALKHRWI